jgi:hypothetical protein
MNFEKSANGCEKAAMAQEVCQLDWNGGGSASP